MQMTTFQVQASAVGFGIVLVFTALYGLVCLARRDNDMAAVMAALMFLELLVGLLVVDGWHLV